MLGDILLNQKYLNSPNTFVSNNTVNGYVTLEHEIGHALGLGDVTSPHLPTIMDYISPDALHPVVDYTASDRLALQALYGSNASTNSANLQDGYIAGATVFSDDNGNGQLDPS